jgi:hypothetical protein
MANETAGMYVPLGREGTGYATILENKLLPSLLNEQKRADRLWQMEQVAQAEARKAAAKKAEEESKFALPYVKAGPAGYYQPEVERVRKQLLMDAQNKFARGGYTQGQKIDEMNQIQGTIDAITNEGAFQSNKLKDVVPDLQKAGFVGANERSLNQYMNSQYGGNKFFDKDHLTGYVEFLKSKPYDNVSPRVIGETLSKQFAPLKMSVQGKNRTTETFEYSPMFKAVETYDPLLKAKVIKAEEPNIPAITKALEGNPAMLEAAGTWIDNKAAEYVRTNPSLTPDKAHEAALGEFWKEATQGLSKSTYDYNIPAPKGAGRTKKMPAIQERGPVEVSFTYVPNYADQYVPKDKNKRSLPKADWDEKTMDALKQQGNLNIGQGTTTYFEKPQTASANKRVILLSNNVDAVREGIVEPDKRGGYTLKTSFAYNAATPIELRVFKENTGFPLGSANPKYTYEKLTPITDDTYEKMTPEQRAKYVTTVKGHLISPAGGVPGETEEGTPKYTPSKVASTQVVVLDESAEDIRSAISRALGGGKSSGKKPFKFKNN